MKQPDSIEHAGGTRQPRSKPLSLRRIFLGISLAIATLSIASLILVDNSELMARGNSSSDGRTPLTFALDWTPNTNHTGIYVAQKLGYFTDAGLNVDIIMPSSSVTKLVASQKIQFGIGFQEFGTASIGNAGKEGLPVVSVAAVAQHNTSGFTALTSKRIRSPKDFEGKIYGGWGDDFEKSMIDYLVKKANGNPNTIEFINIGESSLPGLLQTRIDFAWTYYAWQNIDFENKGLDTHFIALRDLDPIFDYYTPIVMANVDWLKKNGETAKALVQALAKGYEYAATHPQEAAGILLEYAPELDRQLVERSQAYLAPYYLDENGRWGYQKPEVWDRLSTWMYENGIIQNRPETAKVMTNEYLAP